MDTIKVYMKGVDGCSKTRTFAIKNNARLSAILKAREFAIKYVGEQDPETAEGSGYAVSNDGVSRVTVTGCTLRELFTDTPKLDSCAREFIAAIKRIAGDAGKDPEAVYELWLKYGKQCVQWDQSATLEEFKTWAADELGGGLMALLRGVAAALGEGWTFQEPKSGDGAAYFKITHTDGRGFSFYKHSHPSAHFAIHGLYPHKENCGCYGQLAKAHNEVLPSINVSTTQSAERIAAEVTRRLLPQYTELHAKAVKMYDNACQYETGQKSMARKFAGIVGTEPDKNGTSVSIRTTVYEFYGDVRCSDATCSIELNNVPEALATKVLTLLAAHKKVSAE